MVDQLLKFQDLLHIASFWMDAFRDLGFILLKLISTVVDALSGAAKETYKLMNFYQYESVQKFVNDYQPIIWGLGTVALAYFGWQLIVTHKFDRDKIINNIILALTLVFVLPWVMQQGAELTTAGVKLLNGKQTTSVQTFKNNITDLYSVDKAGWKSTKVQNDIENKNDLAVLEMSEKVDTDMKFFEKDPLSDEGKKLLTKRLNKVDGKFEESKMKSFWGIGDPAYYRYSWHPWLIAIELITKALVYAFLAFKSAKLINELGLLYVITSGIALTDIKDGQRNKQLATKIRDTFIVLYLMMFLINFFDIWSGFVASSSLSTLVKPIAIAAGAWLVIDGPNFIEQFFGIDAGLSSVGRTVIATVQGGSAIKNAGSGIGSVTKTAAAKVAGAGRKSARGAAYTGSAIKGALDGFKGSPQGESQGGPGLPVGSDNEIPTSPITATNEKANQEKAPAIPSSLNNASGGKSANNLASSYGENQKGNGTANSTNKVPQAIKNMRPAMAPLSNEAIKRQAEQNKEMLGNIGINPTNSASKARQALDGTPPIPLPPKVSGTQLPSHVQEAKAQLQRDMQPRPIDTETLGEKAVNKYADTARNVYNGPTMTRSRKVYDVSKATSKRINDSFKD